MHILDSEKYFYNMVRKNIKNTRDRNCLKCKIPMIFQAISQGETSHICVECHQSNNNFGALAQWTV